MDRFIECWDGLEDPRTGNSALHDFHEILAIAMCAVLCGAQGSVDMGLFARSKEPFLSGFLKLENGVPSHDTFSRLFRLLDPEGFRAAFQRFMAGFSEQCEGVVAIDGKVLRRSFDSASGRSPLHMVSAWGCEQRLVLAQIATDAKSNEITAVPKLQRFARTIRQDLEAVRNAALEPWSNGQTEGQINKLKTLKRAMYGRAGVHLLRARMIPFQEGGLHEE